MLLFFKASSSESDAEDDKEPLPEKIRRILIFHVKNAGSKEAREQAEEQLQNFAQPRKGRDAS